MPLLYQNNQYHLIRHVMQWKLNTSFLFCMSLYWKSTQYEHTKISRFFFIGKGQIWQSSNKTFKFQHMFSKISCHHLDTLNKEVSRLFTKWNLLDKHIWFRKLILVFFLLTHADMKILTLLWLSTLHEMWQTGRLQVNSNRALPFLYGWLWSSCWNLDVYSLSLLNLP